MAVKKSCHDCGCEAVLGTCECGKRLCDDCRLKDHAQCFERYDEVMAASIAAAEKVRAWMLTSGTGKPRKAKRQRMSDQLMKWMTGQLDT